MINKLIDYLTNYFTPKEQKISMISSYSQIEALMKINNPKRLAFMYNNRVAVNNILYENDQMVKLQTKMFDMKLTNLIYLVMLIKYQKDLVNFAFDLDFIKKVNNKRINTKNKLTIFVLAMIIIELIIYYKNTDFFDEDNEEQLLNEILEENKKIRDDTKGELKNMNLNIDNDKIEENMIIEIYIEIIKSIVENKKLNDYDYCSNIFNEINLNEIELTENIYNELHKIFDNNEKYTNDNKIFQIDDLFNEKKINFHLIIFKFILKNSFYIYNFKFLFESRNVTLKIIKSNSNKIREFMNEQKSKNPTLMEKVTYIIKTFCDSEYYINNYINISNNHLKDILQYYKYFYFIDKKADIDKLENHINNKEKLNEEEINNYLNDFNKAKKLNERKDIIYFLYEERKRKRIQNEKKQIEIDNMIKKYEECEKMIKDKKYMKMRKDDKRILYRYFNKKENKEKIIKIFSQKNLDEFMKSTKEQLKIEPENEEVENNFCKDINEFNLENLQTGPSSNTDSDEKVDIIKFDKKIATHKKSVESIISVKNDKYNISMSKENIYVYDDKYEKIFESTDSMLYKGLSEVPNSKKNEIELIATTEGELAIIKIDPKGKIKPKNKTLIHKIKPNSHLTIDDKNHIIFCKDIVYHCKNLFSDMETQIDKIIDENCLGGIKISEDLIAITSNKNTEKGKGSIFFYKPKKEEIIQEIEGYSFINSNQGLSILTPKEKENEEYTNNILLCACKKNELIKEENGILLINNFKDIKNYNNKNEEKYIKFYPTGNFEVYTFCPLFMPDDIRTDYFLVGGYNNEKKKGEIKLYKIHCDKHKNDIEISLVTNLEYDNKNKKNNNFNGFDGAIKCMIQSKDKYSILIGCSDGNVFKFSGPDFSFDENFNFNQKPDWTILGKMKN